jgi:hypothetical protein
MAQSDYLMTNKEVRAAVLEAQVNAALQGHDLGPFDDVDTRIGGWQAECRRCHMTVWVGESGLMYSLLAETCPGRE